MNVKKGIDKNYIKVFFIAFFIFALSTVPSLISTGGIWIYYGDFNVQQIPFYMHVHRAIREGNFLYDWGTDLGGSLIGMYSFYLTGSPFFLLTLPFPTEAVPYLMPWLSALKYAVMALTAYAYMKRHTKTINAAVLGALLYSFSGFQGATLVYNHFHDVMAFFPLYLLLFERLVERKKQLAFTLFTAFMLILNYYFFVGEVVFLGIYFVTIYLCNTEINLKERLYSLLRAFIAGLSGVLISCVYLIPAIYYTLGNGRLTQVLEGYDLVAYEESTNLLSIIKNVAMLPDLSGLNSMLNQNYSRVSGVGAYIPLFSIAGVVAYFLYTKGKKNGLKRLLITCMVFAAFPVLNALFSALNSEYYARWFYMPVLIMALMTATVIEEKEETAGYLKKGVFAVTVITSVVAVMSVLPAKTEEGTWTVLGALKNYEQLIVELVFSFAMLVILYLYTYIFIKQSEKVTGIIVILACFLTTVTMFTTGTLLVDMDRKDDFISQTIEGESPLSDKTGFYRYETDEDFYNYALVWGDDNCITSFISTINSSILDFYNALSVPRKVTSHLYTSRIGMRALLSSKYYLTNNCHSIEYIGHIEDMEELKGYSLESEKNGFSIYENENFIPMGFTFDCYMTESEFEESELAISAKDRILVRALIVKDEDASQVDSLLTKTTPDEMANTTLQAFEEECVKRAETASTSFETSTYGFTAETDLEKENLVFFSVPYEEGFTAYVDGEETYIYETDFGFMAVKVGEGHHTIEFKYSLSGFDTGLKLSFAGVLIFFILTINVVYHKEKEENAIEECKKEANIFQPEA